MGSFFRCVLRGTSCGSCTLEFSLQYFNPQPTRPSSSQAGTRNPKRFKYSNAPKLIEIESSHDELYSFGL